MNFKAILFVAVAIASTAVSAQVERKLFTMEKNYNPENIMIIHTQTDKDCKFVTSTKNAERNYLEFYWNMNFGAEKKEVHSMIRSEIKERVQFVGINERRDLFRIKLNDLTELRHDLTDTTVDVSSEISQGKCNVKSILHLGASGNYAKMNVKKVYCDVTKNMIGVPNGCSFIQLEGTDADTGAKIFVKFKKK